MTTITPLTGTIGAAVKGVDLTGPLGADVVAELRQALLRWKVLFFRGQHVTPAQQVAFGRRFGALRPIRWRSILGNTTGNTMASE